jgi:hypothetical protein
MLATVFGFRPAIHNGEYYYAYDKKLRDEHADLQTRIATLIQEGKNVSKELHKELRQLDAKSAARSVHGDPYNPFNSLPGYDVNDAFKALFFQGFGESSGLGIMYKWEESERGLMIKNSVSSLALNTLEDFYLTDARYMPLINDGKHVGENIANEKGIAPHKQPKLELPNSKVLLKWPSKNSASLTHSLPIFANVTSEAIHDFSKGFSPASLLTHTETFGRQIVTEVTCQTDAVSLSDFFAVRVVFSSFEAESCALFLRKLHRSVF